MVLVLNRDRALADIDVSKSTSWHQHVDTPVDTTTVENGV